MKTLLIVLALVIASSVEAADDFSIDSWEFDWKVAESGDCRLVLHKDPKSITVMLRGQFRGIDLAPEDAEAVGRGLSKTPEMVKSLNGTRRKREVVTAGKYSISFSTSDTGTFHASIRLDEGLASNSITLSREQALDIAPYLVKSKAMVAHLDKMIDPSKAKTSDPEMARKLAEVAKAEAARAEASLAKARAQLALVKVEAEMAQAKRQIAEIREEAAKKLTLAKSFVNKDKATAKKRLTDIVDSYPDTPAAEEAKALLQKL